MKSRNKIVKALLMISQIGISMMVPIFLCVFLGLFIDRKTGKNFFVILFLLLGICAAFRNVYLLLRPFYEKDKEREDAALSYVENLKREGYDKQAESGGLKKNGDKEGR